MTRLLVLAMLAGVLFSVTESSVADLIVFEAQLDGASESPLTASPGTGFATVSFDDVAHSMRVMITFSDLIGATTASHIHAPTAASDTGNAGVTTQVPTFTGFPLGVTSGSYDHTFDTLDLATYNPAFVTANGGTAASAEAVLEASLLASKAYLNIHSSLFPGGEIRGFLHQVPEPGSVVLFGTGVVAVIGWHRRSARKKSPCTCCCASRLPGS